MPCCDRLRKVQASAIAAITVDQAGAAMPHKGADTAAASVLAILCLVILVCEWALSFRAVNRMRSLLDRADAELRAVSDEMQSQAKTLQATVQDLHTARDQCLEQAATIAAILDSVEQGVVLVAADRTVTACNRHVIEILNLPPDIMQHDPSFGAVLAQQWQAQDFSFTPHHVARFMRPGGVLDRPHRCEWQRPDGVTLEVRGRPLANGGFVQTYADVTRRKRAEQRVTFLEGYDELTGLLNRRACLDRMAQILTKEMGDTRGLVILELDLDRFRQVNEKYGYAVGDTLLRLAARRMQSVLRPTDTLARLGGDNFAVLLEQDAMMSATPDIAERLRRAVSEPYEVAGTILHVDVSIGGAFSRDGSITVDALLRDVQAALRCAKIGGRGPICLHQEGSASGSPDRVALERDLLSALELNQFRLVYQPVIDVRTGRPVSCEALLRWHHPRAGVLKPSQFMPVVREMGLLAPLSRLVLRLACQEAAIWAAQVRVSINLAVAQLTDAQFGRDVLQALGSSGLAPQRLELEIAEGVPSTVIAQTGLVMQTLQRTGVRFVMDDFGTGSASLEAFQTLPFQQIKIGQAFVARLFDDDRPGTVIPAILAMAAAMNVDVVAEGVATQAQADELRRLGCRLLQGFLFAEPGSPEWVRQYLWRSSTGVADPDGMASQPNPEKQRGKVC